MSEPFFDADNDPIFVQGMPDRRGLRVPVVPRRGARGRLLRARSRRFAPAWSLVSAAGERRTGVRAASRSARIHRQLGRLYVPMHRGGEGTHKDGGTEIWVFDLKTHQRLARWPLHGAEAAPVVAVQVSQDAAPLLFAATRQGRRRGVRRAHGHVSARRKAAGPDAVAVAESLKARRCARSTDCSKTPRARWRGAPRAAACSATLGQMLTGAALLPLLPIDRASRAAARAESRPSAEGATRSRELRVLEVLRDRRLPVLLLRRHLELLPAGYRALAHHLDRHLPQSGRRPRLHRLLQRLLR